MRRDNQIQPSGCHRSIDRSDAEIIMGAGGSALLRPWREEACPETPSGTSRPSQPRHGTGAKPSVSPVRAAHAEFVRVLVRQPPRTIPLMADAIDLEDRADHLGHLFWALSVYVAVVLDDTAQNVSGRLDLRDAEAVLAHLASDVVGAIQQAAGEMAGGRA